FTIAANSTQATFVGGATSIPLQTGTTAGTIFITPSFSTQSGFNLTPASPAPLNLTIARTEARLSGASISGATTNAFTVILNGYSTSRGVSQLDVQVTPKTGTSFAATHVTLDVRAPSSAWYQSTASQAFGGAFLIAIPFNLSGGGTSDLVHMI